MYASVWWLLYSNMVELVFHSALNCFMNMRISNTYVNSSFCFFVTSHCKHILSNGNSFLLAVLCIIAVSRDCGLKKPPSQTDAGNWKIVIIKFFVFSVTYMGFQLKDH